MHRFDEGMGLDFVSHKDGLDDPVGRKGGPTADLTDFITQMLQPELGGELIRRVEITSVIDQFHRNFAGHRPS